MTPEVVYRPELYVNRDKENQAGLEVINNAIAYNGKLPRALQVIGASGAGKSWFIENLATQTGLRFQERPHRFPIKPLVISFQKPSLQYEGVTHIDLSKHFRSTSFSENLGATFLLEKVIGHYANSRKRSDPAFKIPENTAALIDGFTPLDHMRDLINELSGDEEIPRIIFFDDALSLNKFAIESLQENFFKYFEPPTNTAIIMTGVRYQGWGYSYFQRDLSSITLEGFTKEQTAAQLDRMQITKVQSLGLIHELGGGLPGRNIVVAESTDVVAQTKDFLRDIVNLFPENRREEISRVLETLSTFTSFTEDMVFGFLRQTMPEYYEVMQNKTMKEKILYPFMENNLVVYYDRRFHLIPSVRSSQQYLLKQTDRARYEHLHLGVQKIYQNLIEAYPKYTTHLKKQLDEQIRAMSSTPTI